MGITCIRYTDLAYVAGLRSERGIACRVGLPPISSQPIPSPTPSHPALTLCEPMYVKATTLAPGDRNGSAWRTVDTRLYADVTCAETKASRDVPCIFCLFVGHVVLCLAIAWVGGSVGGCNSGWVWVLRGWPSAFVRSPSRKAKKRRSALVGLRNKARELEGA